MLVNFVSFYTDWIACCDIDSIHLVDNFLAGVSGNTSASEIGHCFMVKVIDFVKLSIVRSNRA